MANAQFRQPQRALVVEDESLIAMLIEDMLAELGCEHVVTASTVDQALRFAHQIEFDLAILDVQLRGERVDPVATALTAVDCPLIFATGCTGPDMPQGFDGVPILTKPFRLHDLRRVSHVALSRSLGEGLHPPANGRALASSWPRSADIATMIQ